MIPKTSPISSSTVGPMTPSGRSGAIAATLRRRLSHMGRMSSNVLLMSTMTSDTPVFDRDVTHSISGSC